MDQFPEYGSVNGSEQRRHFLWFPQRPFRPIRSSVRLPRPACRRHAESATAFARCLARIYDVLDHRRASWALAVVACLYPAWFDAFETQLTHPQLAGFVAWDLIMPVFLFVVGAAMPLALAKRSTAGRIVAGRPTAALRDGAPCSGFSAWWPRQPDEVPAQGLESVQQHASRPSRSATWSRRWPCSICAEGPNRRAVRAGGELLGCSWRLCPFGGHPAGQLRADRQFRPLRRRTGAGQFPPRPQLHLDHH